MADVNINLFKKIEENTTETDGFPEGYLIASVNGKVQGINPYDIGGGGGVFIRRSAFTPPFTSYRGFAPENSLETDAVWTITKTVENANGTVFSNEQVFNHKWTEINTI